MTASTRRLAALAFGLASIAICSPARADERADAQAEAVALFDQGIKDLRAGKLDKACPELQASLDRVKDSGTKGALARCHGLTGRVATAWLLWRELSDTAPTADLRSDAAAQAAKLEPRLPHYTIKLARPDERVEVQINGRIVATVATNVPVPVPVDPGPVTVRARSRRGAASAWSHDFMAVEGQLLEIEVPDLEPRYSPPQPPGIVERSAPAPDPSQAAIDAALTTRKRYHEVALSFGAVAVSFIVIGTFEGLSAHNQFASAQSACGGSVTQCKPDQLATAQASVDQARSNASGSTLSFVIAGGAAAAAVGFWLRAPSVEPSRQPLTITPSVAPGQTSLLLIGKF